MHSEPVLIMAALRSGLLCVTAFGLDLTGEQTAAVMLFAEALLAVFTRTKVSPVDKHGELRQAPHGR